MNRISAGVSARNRWQWRRQRTKASSRGSSVQHFPSSSRSVARLSVGLNTFRSGFPGCFRATRKTGIKRRLQKREVLNAFRLDAAGLQLAAYILLIAVALLLVFVAWKVWQHNRITRPFAAAAPVPAGTPDLRDETVRRPHGCPAMGGWTSPAKKSPRENGGWLCVRSFSPRSRVTPQQGWLSLAKFKTNLDYETELRRRVHGRANVVDEFRDHRRRFEEVWYGATPASDVLARDWLRQMEGHGMSVLAQMDSPCWPRSSV